MINFSARVIQSVLLRKFAILAAILLLTALPAFAFDIYVDATCSLADAINSAQGATLPEDVDCEAGDTTTGSPHLRP